MIKHRNVRANGLPDKDWRKGEIYRSQQIYFQDWSTAIKKAGPLHQWEAIQKDFKSSTRERLAIMLIMILHDDLFFYTTV